MADDISKGVLTDFQNNTEQLKSSLAQLTQQLDELQKKQAEMGQGVAKYSDEFKKGSISIKETQKAIKDLNGQVVENSKTLQSAKGSLQQNKDLLADLEERYTTLSRSEGDNAKQVKELNVQIEHLSATIDKQEKKLEKSREVFDYHTESIEALKGAFEKIKNSDESFGKTLDEVTEGFNAMKTGIGAVKTGLQSVDGAIKTTGFGLLILVLKSLVEYFTNTTEGSKKLHGAMAVVGKVVETINAAFGKLGGIIVDAVSHPIDSLKKIGEFLKENLINRFNSLGVILDGIIHLDFKKIGDGLIQSVSGVTNATDKIKTAYNKTKADIVAAGKVIADTYNRGAAEAGKAKKTEEQLAKEKEELLAKQQHQREERQRKQAEATERAKQKHAADLKDAKATNDTFNDLETQSNARKAEKVLNQYDSDVKAIKDYYAQKLEAYEKFIGEYEGKAAKDPEYKKLNKQNYETAQKGVATFKADEKKELIELSDNFQQNELDKLTAYENKLREIAANAKKTARELAIAQVNDKYKADEDAIKKALQESITRENQLRYTNPDDPESQKKIAKEINIQNAATSAASVLNDQKSADKKAVDNNFDAQNLQENISNNEQGGHFIKALKEQQQLLDLKYSAEVAAAKKRGDATTKIDEDYAKKKAELEDKLTTSKIHAGDKYIDAVLKTAKKIRLFTRPLLWPKKLHLLLIPSSAPSALLWIH
ncbi:hypothetical protein CKK33_16400 [Mucilaginibacter sp. MD40]|uniref:hypothetical protein n=1 Tax=Mucilaginibacter sp. MD40 TaxID=2029590 RepID=UPI000BACCCBF|nr:hypothetical protein [Mucilaginibacter sp. MD40]PAW94993.1 hypothetical protein CKK33_16400 [Mucilaginibacter sp. MD40]